MIIARRLLLSIAVGVLLVARGTLHVGQGLSGNGSGRGTSLLFSQALDVCSQSRFALLIFYFGATFFLARLWGGLCDNVN